MTKRARNQQERFVKSLPDTTIYYEDIRILSAQEGSYEWVLPGGRRTTDRNEALAAAQYISRLYFKSLQRIIRTEEKMV